MELILKTFLSLLILATIVKCSRYTPEEKKGLKQLREKLDYLLYEPYMKTDFYLINFLRVKHNDISAAAQMLEKAQNWRIAQRMDNILNETNPWSDFLKILPYRTDGVDRFGSPFIEVPAGKWDIRTMIVAGNGDLYVHYIVRTFEDVFQKVRLANANNPNITQWQILWDLDGYKAKQHACLACIPRQIQYVSEYEAYYPLRLKAAWIVNSPRVFQNLLNILKMVMSPATKRVLEIHGRDESEWKPTLHRVIDPSQLLPIFGGTKV